MSTPAEICAAVCALLVCGCNLGPEVVATEQVPDKSDGASFPTPILVSECSPGTYNGTFSTSDPTDGGQSPFPFAGDFTFELKQINNKEFLTLANDAPLNGSSPAGTFQAILEGGRNCVGGSINSAIENGEFLVSGSKTPTPFSGSVQGHYDSSTYTFGGTWQTILVTPTPVYLGGTWSATHEQ